MKKCDVCGEVKPESEFFVRHRNKNGSINLSSDCKRCHCEQEMQRYYKKREFIDSRKTPCVKCGESRLMCLSFHHKQPSEKEFTIGKVRKSSLKVIEQEINKCICLCFNCHREFHYLNSAVNMTLDEYLNN